MASLANELSRLAAEAERIERAAYQRGWDDAVAHILAAARTPAQTAQRALPLADGGTTSLSPERPVIEVVLDAVRSIPGRRGSSIVDAVMQANPHKDRKSLDRTTRTALMRLRKRQAIENRNGLWYPKEAA